MINLKSSIISSLFVLIIVFSLFSVSAINLDIVKTPVNDFVVSDLNQPGIFLLNITNHGIDDHFSIYSLVGVKIEPQDSFFIASGDSKLVTIKVYPNRDLKQDSGSLVFIYKIKGDNSGIKEDTLNLNVIKLENAFSIGTYSIEPQSEQATIYFNNNYNINYDKISAKFVAVFFGFSQSFSLGPFEKKDFTIPLMREKTSLLSAGQYILKTDLDISGVEKTLESNIRFSEKNFIDTQQEDYGFAVNKVVIMKTNKGNLESMADIVVKKNIISRLFTTFNLDPYKVERTGFSVYYYWQKELKPSDIFTVRVTTNWLIPLLVVVAAIILAFFISVYRRSFVIVRKKVSFVRAKGGQFGLKVSLHVRGRGFVERVKVFDRVPAIAKLYERFGAIAPSRFDASTRRLEWNLGTLDRGEERVLTYIIYSKVGVVGKFELPKATAVYEKDNRIHESESNKAYFVTEPRIHDEF